MLSVVYCTKDAWGDHLFTSNMQEKADEGIEFIPKEGYSSISKAYNEGIKEAKNDTIVLCHNDISMLTEGYDKIIEGIFAKYPKLGIIGVVGSDKFDGATWCGTDSHSIGRLVQYYGKKHLGKRATYLVFSKRNLGKDYVRAACVDGVFIAIRRDRIKELFDIGIKGFHFYDVCFCVDNLSKGVMVGVTYKLEVIHYSDGNRDDQWKKIKEEYVDKKYNGKVFKVDVTDKDNDHVAWYWTGDNHEQILKELEGKR